MKIRKLHLKNYKVFDDLELDFTDENGETLNEIVIAGVNGSGKTTVLEFIRDTLAKNLDNIKNADSYALYSFPDFYTANSFSHLIRKHKIVDVESYKYFFVYSLNSENCVEVKIHQPAKEANRMAENLKKVPYYGDLPAFTPNVLSKAIFRPANDNDELEDGALLLTVSLNANKAEMEKSIIKSIRNKVFENEKTPSGEIIKKEINSLNKIFDGIKINSKLIHLNDDKLIFESLNGNKIGFNDLSSGEKHLYFLGFMLKNLNINNSMIIIDEPEDSLHPTWQQQILKFYSNIGENNQVILATHSPHIIGSAKPESVFLLKPENGKINAYHPTYSGGHSINYVLSEVMETDYQDTRIIKIVDEYVRLIGMGMHETQKGQELWSEIKQLDPNSEERNLIDLSLRRYKVLSK